jgi:hypothetical protein
MSGGTGGQAWRGGVPGTHFRGGPGSHRFAHTRHHRKFGPAVGFEWPYFYDYGYSTYDNCYETRYVRTRKGWRYVNVYVCPY